MNTPDPSFGIPDEVLGILKKLTYENLGTGAIETYPWFNGDEKGAALILYETPYPTWTACHILTFGLTGEKRFFVEVWRQEHPPFNGPSPENRRPVRTLSYEIFDSPERVIEALKFHVIASQFMAQPGGYA